MWEELVNKKLYKYITENIFKEYDLNGEAHNIEHIKCVLERALRIAKKYENINYDMLFTAVSYHDIGDHIDRANHEIVSAQIMMNNKVLNDFFDSEEKQIIKQAIEEHRASKGKTPVSIYGKILASADKTTDVNTYFKRACQYGMEHYVNITDEEQLDRVYEHAVKKFGKNGYAVNQYFVEDDAYERYLHQLQDLIDDKERFYEIAAETYKDIKGMQIGN